MSASTESPLGARVSRAELVARELEREIADGLKAGHRLGTKDDLRKRFRVAVATLNEAMRLLEMRGLIEARPGPGRWGVRRAPRSTDRDEPCRARVQDGHHELRGVPRAPRRARAAGRQPCGSLPPGARHPRAQTDREEHGGVGQRLSRVFHVQLGIAPADRRDMPKWAAPAHVPRADRLSRVQHRSRGAVRLRRRRDRGDPSRSGGGDRCGRGSGARRSDRGAPAEGEEEERHG